MRKKKNWEKRGKGFSQRPEEGSNDRTIVNDSYKSVPVEFVLVLVLPAYDHSAHHVDNDKVDHQRKAPLSLRFKVGIIAVVNDVVKEIGDPKCRCDRL